MATTWRSLPLSPSDVCFMQHLGVIRKFDSQAATDKRFLNHMLRRQPAVFAAGFNLHGGMADTEIPLKLGCDYLQRPVTGMAAWHHQMCRQRRLGGADRPDMKIVDSDHTGPCG